MVDEKIIELSKNNQKTILTMDKDFGFLTFHENKMPYGVILIRIHPFTPEIIFDGIKKILDKIIKEKIELKRKFIVSDGITLRIREI